MKKNYLIILVIIAVLSSCSLTQDKTTISDSFAGIDGSSGSNLSEIPTEKTEYEQILENVPCMPEIMPTKTGLYQIEEIALNTDWIPYDTIDAEGYLLKISPEFLPIITNDTPVEEMISEVDNLMFIWPSMSDLRNFYPSRISYTMEEMLTNEYDMDIRSKIPINFLRKVGDEEYYTVVKLHGGGYMYYLFAPDVKDTENVYFWGGIYSENRVSYSDFLEIKIGDSISKVISVDSSARMALVEHKYHQEVLSTVNFEPFAQVFLLTDGILEITYELADMSTEAHPEFGEEYQIIPMTRDELVVADIKYFPDSIYSSTKCIENHGVEQNLHINILPQDYPPAS